MTGDKDRLPVQSRSAVTLRFYGDDIDPDELTNLLGKLPTVGVAKGGVWTTRGGVQKPARRGSWRLEASRRSPADVDGQIDELLSSLTDDLDVWKRLSTSYQADMFCGLFMARPNEMFGLRSATLKAIGLRGLELNFDIYSADHP